MPTIDRSTIIRGPASITFGGQNFFTKDNVSVTVENSIAEQTSDIFGVVGRVKTDTQVRVSFTPVGDVQNAQTAVLYPYLSTALGTSIYGSSDSQLVITGLLNKLIVENAAVTSMPSLTLGAGTTAFGEVEFTGLVKKGAEPDLEASYYVYSESSNSYPATFNPTNVKSGEYQATYLGYTHASTEGFTVDFDLSLAPVVADNNGTIDMRIQDVQWTANWSPIVANFPDYILQYLTQSVAPGQDVYTNSITIAGQSGQISFTADKAALVSSDFTWGVDANLNGPISVQSVRDINSGALDPICAIATV